LLLHAQSQPIKRWVKDAFVVTIEGKSTHYKSFEDLWAKGCEPDKFYRVSREEEEVIYECYTKQQLETYYDQLLEFYGKGKDSGN
jgi:hypothetical protein